MATGTIQVTLSVDGTPPANPALTLAADALLASVPTNQQSAGRLNLASGGGAAALPFNGLAKALVLLVVASSPVTIILTTTDGTETLTGTMFLIVNPSNALSAATVTPPVTGPATAVDFIVGG